MSAIFDLQSMFIVLLLMICTCTYLHAIVPNLFNPYRNGWRGSFWKMARIGERCSPYVSCACALMAIKILFWDN